ncbi:MAG: LysM peptidoglycan-binding domain-containing protein, partial [Burkholderiales bacterium]
MRKFITALLISWAATSYSAEVELTDSPPDRYTVVKGDTLWDISGRFLKKPWRWPEIWQMNKEEIKNPHLIYPGDVIVLDLSGASPRLKLLAGGKSGRETIKLSPTARIENISSQAIPAIPPAAIEPFLSNPLVVEQNGLAHAPRILAPQEDRVSLGAGDKAYVSGLTNDKGNRWQIYRHGKALVDPDSHQVLGYEAVYLGDARVLAFGEV